MFKKNKKYTLFVVVLIALFGMLFTMTAIYADAIPNDPSLGDGVNNDQNYNSQPYTAPALSSPLSTPTSTSAPTAASYASNAAPTSTSSSSGSGLVPCNNSTTQPCNFNSLMTLVYNVIHFVLFDLTIPIAAIMFAYAGFMYLTSGDNSGKRATANKVFTSVVFGLIIAIAAWLIVSTILHILGWNGSWIGF